MNDERFVRQTRPILEAPDRAEPAGREGGLPPGPARPGPPVSPDETPRASYLGFLAHEVRNPLATALWSAELLARISEEERGGARGVKLSGMCLRSLQRMRLLLEDHFLVERLAAGGLPARPEALDLSQLLDEIAARPGAPRFERSLQGGASLWLDRALAIRILEALLAAASRGGERVEVKSEPRDGALGLRVRGAPPPPEPFALPRKGALSDPSGRALSLHAAHEALHHFGGALALEGSDYLAEFPVGPVARV